ncbi:DUF4364 family protein [Oscillospiraceae bacterium PP1C4]
MRGELDLYDVFRAGVEPGGLTMDYEIKILICYMLHQLERPMPISALIEVFVDEGIGNYFEAASASSGLVKSGHIVIETVEDERCYVITALGINASQTFEKNLPLSIRNKAVEAAKRYFVMKKHRAQNKTELKKVPDGYLLTLTITDVGSDLLTLTILLPDIESCEQIQNRFIKDPIVVYKGVVALLTGSYENVGALMDTPE